MSPGGTDNSLVPTGVVVVDAEHQVHCNQSDAITVAVCVISTSDKGCGPSVVEDIRPGFISIPDVGGAVVNRCDALGSPNARIVDRELA